MRRRLISLLLPNLIGGGAERVNIDLAYEFARAGHSVEFVLLQAQGEFLEEARANFSVVDLGAPRLRNLPFALIRYIRRRRPDALLAAMWPLTVVAPFAARLSGNRCNVMISEHNSLSIQYSNWGRFHRVLMSMSMATGYRLANSRVAVSQGVAKDIASLSGMRLDEFNVIYNPVALRAEPSVDTLQEAEAMWSDRKGARILTVGSMKPQKNHSLLLRALAQLDRPNAQLMFVGDGAGRDELLSLAKELGVADRVILAGFHLDPTPFYKTADLFVLSSNYEGFGNVIVEALACGTPVVSTDCPSGPREILQDGRFGTLVPVGNASALTEAISSILSSHVDPNLLKRRALDFGPAIAGQKYLSHLFEGGSI